MNKRTYILIFAAFAMISNLAMVYPYSNEMIIVNGTNEHDISIWSKTEGKVPLGYGKHTRFKYKEKNIEIGLGGIATFTPVSALQRPVSTYFAKKRMGGLVLPLSGTKIEFPKTVGLQDILILRILPKGKYKFIGKLEHALDRDYEKKHGWRKKNKGRNLYKRLSQDINYINTEIKKRAETGYENQDTLNEDLKFLDIFNNEYMKILEGKVSFKKLKSKMKLIKK